MIPLKHLHVVLIYLTVINVVTFFMYGIDKWKAKNSKWRIRETALLGLAVLGGSIGAWLGMKVWHHKTQHKGGNRDIDNIVGGYQFKYGVPAIIISLGSHATTDNLAENPEFTVTFATADTMIASDYVGIVSGRNTPDKMEKTGWTIEKAPNVNAPVFKEFPMTLECRVKQKIDESETGYYLVAEIVNILCDEKYLAEDGKPDVDKMKLITFDPVHHTYIQLGKTVGIAFSDGKQLK